MGLPVGCLYGSQRSLGGAMMAVIGEGWRGEEALSSLWISWKPKRPEILYLK